MTRKIADKRWRCRTCHELVRQTEMLTAPNPFDGADTLFGCPHCKQCDEGFMEICDEPTCINETNCGWPTGDDNDAWGGYRRTCGKHAQFGNAAIVEGKTC